MISDSIQFFHLDALISAVPMRINVNTQLTVMASMLYRLLRVRVGCAEAETLFRDLVRLSGKVTIRDHEILVKLGIRSKQDTSNKQDIKIPWLENKLLRIQLVKRT